MGDFFKKYNNGIGAFLMLIYFLIQKELFLLNFISVSVILLYSNKFACVSKFSIFMEFIRTQCATAVNDI